MEDASDDDPRVFDHRDVRLLDFEEGAVFSYHYDFGDGWRHTVAVEKFLTLSANPKHGTCVAGERARPPEDAGGVSGYERFLEIISDPEDPEYAETIRWCGGYFNPEWFDLSAADKDLRNALRSNAKRRLYQPKPKAVPKKLVVERVEENRACGLGQARVIMIRFQLLSVLSPSQNR
jgi:hypothetical protein